MPSWAELGRRRGPARHGPSEGDLGRSRCYLCVMRALALDVGSKTIGLALAGEAGVATAWETLGRAGQVADVAEVCRRVEAEGVTDVVVGLPLELDGREGHRVRLVRRFVHALEARLTEVGGVELHWWDERFSTAAAERTLLEADVSRRDRKTKIDAVAAQFILQGWMDARLADAARGAYSSKEQDA